MISAVIVSYRSGALAREAAGSFRSEAARDGADLEVVAVVNSADPEEAEAIGDAADRVLLPARNLGFAGGLNAGIAAARGDLLLLSNADLVLRPGALAALVAPLGGGDAVAAGPAFFWDEEEQIFQPPADEPRPLELRRRQLERAKPGAGPRLFRRELRRVLKARSAAETGSSLPATSLRGALVALRRETFARVGPFDERYPLYYEENDWQRRLRAGGGRLVYAGASHVVHRYNQSARREPRASAWFAESERRYFGEHFGSAGLRALDGLAATPTPPPPCLPAAGSEGLCWEDPGGPVGVALSPLPGFRPFLLARVSPEERTFSLPDPLRRGIAGERWYARLFRLDSGAVLQDATLET